MPICARASLVCAVLSAAGNHLASVSAEKHHLRQLSDLHQREKADRLRHFDANDLKTFPQQQPMASTASEAAADLFKSIVQGHPGATNEELNDFQSQTDAQLLAEKAFFDALLAKHVVSAAAAFMSMAAPSDSPSSAPTLSSRPSSSPSDSPSAVPSAAQTTAPTRTPSVTDVPTATPSASPSAAPSISSAPSTAPTIPVFPSVSPTTSFPTTAPTSNPTNVDTASPTFAPTSGPTAAPTSAPTAVPTVTTTSAPSFARCGMSEQDRANAIEAVILEALGPDTAGAALINDLSTPEGLATDWLINQDDFGICPDNDKLIQRWTLAVVYYSTNGDNWFGCSANVTINDDCGLEEPFVGEQRFLSPVGECEWAGISCINDCVTELEFEENNLIGTIPTEIGLLDHLAIWGMERGGLTSTIPTEVGRLANLIFLDLDFNQLTGSLSSELLSLTAMTQLDLNNNQMTGSINDIGVFNEMEFLQLHDNFFTGTVPEAVGNFFKLGVFTLHETAISGTMPQSVCNLRTNAGFGGRLDSLIADCSVPSPDIICTCCSDCRNT